ncbi:MAG: hypothetical protein DWQ09_10400 [Proteobacteria bacterium]|nr:MAG: hypothetical protein DWQ09_10400 [Pseudomonadota bacterium]
MRIRISWASGQVVARLKESVVTRRLLHTLPYRSQARLWGDEVYFKLPLSMEDDTETTDVVEPGTVCYWTSGGSLAIPFGPTPASRSDECRLVEPVSVLGHIEGEAKILRKIHAGDTVQVSRVVEPW